MVEYLLFFFLVFVVSFCVFLFESKKWSFPVLISNVSTLCQFVFLAVAFSFFDSSNVGYAFFNDVAIFDCHSNILKLSLLIIGFFSVIFTKFYSQKKKIFQYEYVVFFVFSILGLLILCVSFDFLSLYLAIELQSLSFYVLAIFFWNSEYNLESGLKYFILGSFMSCLFLFGFAFVYLSVGSTSIEVLQNLLAFEVEGYSLTVVGISFVILAILFKIGVFPFHLWLCDVYEGALLSTTLFFAIVPKIVLFYILIKFLFFGFANASWLTQNSLFTLATCSIFIGAAGALFQRKLKRLLAFSSISHAGFVLLAIACFSLESTKAICFYLIVYILTSFILFSLVALAISKSGLLKYLVNWLAFGKRNYLIAICFSAILLSMAGVPPLIGFFSKLLVFSAMLKNSNLVVSLLIALLSCVSCFYYIRIIKILFFETPSKAEWLVSTSRNLETIISFGLFVICFVLIHSEMLFLTIFGFTLSFFTI